MRIGVGCMRLSTEADRDEAQSLAVLAAALDAGVSLFDTARAYAAGDDELGHNERLIARAWRARPAPPAARVVTKCGMRRDGGAWLPDGRAKTIAEDAAASAAALDGVPIDVLLLHAPDPRVSLSTTARALAAARERGLAQSVGVCNVSRKQLEEIAAHAPIAAVEVALGAYDDLALRNGVVAYCLERRIEVLAHAPLGGPARAERLARDPVLVGVAARHAPSGPLDAFLAYLLAVHREIIPIVGARRPETIARLARAERLALDARELATLDARFASLGALRRPPPSASTRDDVEVVLLVGVPGAGKSRAAEALVARGYERLNRDTLGGTLRGIAKRLDERLGAGAKRLVLDNTYVTRATRYDMLRTASAHGARVRSVFLDTPQEQAQINVVLRMLERFGRVIEPAELDELVKTEPAALAPRAVSRMARDLEPPVASEGFSEVEIVPFVREHRAGPAALVVAFDALGESDDVRAAALVARLIAAPADKPCLVYGWRPEITQEAFVLLQSSVEAAARASDRLVELALCRHAAGPPICWCRPPLPALLLAFAHRHCVDLRASTLLGKSAADRTLARALEMTFVPSAEGFGPLAE